jgi:sugar lactone lactonase YvrE
MRSSKSCKLVKLIMAGYLPSVTTYQPMDQLLAYWHHHSQQSSLDRLKIIMKPLWLALTFIFFGTVSHAQDDALLTDIEAVLKYPLSVAADGEGLYVVDLDLPGVWQVMNDKRELFVMGSKFLRKPLNRPRCVVMHPQGGILVGDSATREVYHVAAKDAQPKPLCNARIGIAMALAISPDGKSFYVGDAEKRATFRLPIEGGEPELVARVNARGLAFDPEGNLWAVTPDDAAVHRIDVKANSSVPVITGRPYQYPNGLVWSGDHGFVTDGYGKSIWKFTADGKTEKWFEGEPLVGPVGMAINDQFLFVADPKKLQVFRFDRSNKSITNRL